MTTNIYTDKDYQELVLGDLEDAIENLDKISVYNDDKFADQIASLNIILESLKNMNNLPNYIIKGTKKSEVKLKLNKELLKEKLALIKAQEILEDFVKNGLFKF